MKNHFSRIRKPRPAKQSVLILALGLISLGLYGQNSGFTTRTKPKISLSFGGTVSSHNGSILDALGYEQSLQFQSARGLCLEIYTQESNTVFSTEFRIGHRVWISPKSSIIWKLGFGYGDQYLKSGNAFTGEHIEGYSSSFVLEYPLFGGDRILDLHPLLGFHIVGSEDSFVPTSAKRVSFGLRMYLNGRLGRGGFGNLFF